MIFVCFWWWWWTEDSSSINTQSVELNGWPPPGRCINGWSLKSGRTWSSNERSVDCSSSMAGCSFLVLLFVLFWNNNSFIPLWLLQRWPVVEQRLAIELDRSMLDRFSSIVGRSFLMLPLFFLNNNGFPTAELDRLTLDRFSSLARHSVHVWSVFFWSVVVAVVLLVFSFIFRYRPFAAVVPARSTLFSVSLGSDNLLGCCGCSWLIVGFFAVWVGLLLLFSRRHFLFLSVSPTLRQFGRFY